MSVIEFEPEISGGPESVTWCSRRRETLPALSLTLYPCPTAPIVPGIFLPSQLGPVGKGDRWTKWEKYHHQAPRKDAGTTLCLFLKIKSEIY